MPAGLAAPGTKAAYGEILASKDCEGYNTVTMWEHLLTVLCLLSAALSTAVIVLSLVTLKRIGEPAACDEASSTESTISVVVPARNEEAGIRRAILSLFGQKGVRLEIIVVNDHSTDKTRDIVDEIAASDSRVRVVHDPPLRPGWFGKCNAMEHGARLATGPYLALCDADVVHAPHCFLTGLGEMKRDGLDFISYGPLIVCESFWENVLLPPLAPAGTLALAGFGANDPSSRDADATGAFILMKREVFLGIGGFDLVKTEMLDDVMLARLVKSRGYRVRYRLATRLLQVRLFKGNREAFWGLTKNVLATFDNLWVALPGVFLPVLVYWVPLAGAVAGVWKGNWLLAAAGCGTYLVGVAMLVVARRLCRFQWRKALFFPLVVLPLVCSGLRALYYRMVKGAVAWRGRAIAIGEARGR